MEENNNNNSANNNESPYSAPQAASTAFDAEDLDKNKSLGIVMAIFPILFFLPLIMDDRKNSKFLKFYMNTELCITVLYALSGIIQTILKNIPIIGWFAWLVPTAIFVFHLITFIYVIQLNGKKVPILGEITILK